MTLKETMHLWRLSWGDFRTALPQFVGFEILIKLLGLVLITPVSVAITGKLLEYAVGPAATNYELIALALNPLGWLTALVGGAFLFLGFYLETAGLVLIAARLQEQTRLSSFRAIGLLIKKLPGLLATALATFGCLLAWAAPFLAAGGATYWLLTRAHDINYYLTEQPPVFIGAAIFAGALGVGLFGAVTRAYVMWVFVVPVALFEGRIGWAALRRSRDLVRGALRRTVATLAAIVVVVGMVSAAVASGVGVLTGMALTTVDHRLALGGVALLLVWALHLVLSGLITLIFVPLTTAVVTRLYFELRQRTEGRAPPLNIFAQVPGRASGEPMPISRWLVYGAAVLLLAAMVVVGAILAEAVYMTDSSKVIAHRGDSARAPENTLSALRKAMELHPDYAEIDLQETRDGAILVLHDNDLMKVARVPKGLWQLTFNEARTLDVGSWFAPEFKGEQLPTLDEVIDLVDGRMNMIFELKYNGHDRRLPERVVDIIRRRGFQDQCIISSLNYKGLQRVKELDPTIRTAYILFGGVGHMAQLNADGIGMPAMFLTADFVDKCHAHDKEVLVWTVNDPADMDRFIEMDVDYIYTDKPADLIEVLRRRAARSPAEKIKDMFSTLL